jgi:hypothetical protein
MSMMIYTRFSQMLAGAGNFTSDVFYAMLERSTSTYSPNIDHDFVSDLSGFVEISVASYARQLLGSKANAVNDANDRTELDCADLAFGNLESGQTVKSLIIYRQVGGNDATPNDDELVLRFDGTIDVYLAANALINATTIYVDPLPAALANSTALDFGGGGTCTISSGGTKGSRSLTVSALGAARTAGDISTNVPISGNILPFALGGGAFNVVIDTQGLIQFRRPGGPA